MALERETPTSVSAAAISRNFGIWQSRALITPITITHHGRARLVLASTEAFEALRGEVKGLAGEQLTLQNAKLQAILAQMEDGFVAFDQSLHVVELNRAAELYIGIARDQLIGHDMRELVPATKASGIWDYVRRAQQTGKVYQFRIRSTLRANFRLSLCVFPYDNAGVALLFKNLGPLEEVATYAKRSDAARNALAGLPSISVIRLNAQGGVESADRAFLDRAGMANGALTNLLLVDLLHPAHRIQFTRNLNAALQGGSTRPLSVRLLSQPADDAPLMLSMGAVSDADGLPAEVIVYAIDIESLGVELRRNAGEADAGE